MNKRKKIVLGVTGSIAAYKSADIIRGLQENNHDVFVVMTKAAERFITPLTLSTLSGERVLCGMFDEENLPWKMPHITKTQGADVLLIAPATADIIGKIANGIADNFLTCIALATKSPILIAPAMNTEMYKNAIVQENCAKLKKHGMQIIEPVKGKLACGIVGEGHIAEVKDIVKAVDIALTLLKK